MSNQFQETIKALIDTKREGEYWDFKVEHHHNKDDLLHDIICMANNRADRDAYIIYGIDDATGEIRGVENDTHRKKQQNIIDFLREKPFANGVRPTVELKELELQGHIVDVLIIKNTYDTPYYLTERYNSINPNHIYTRVGDTNTPKNKNADYNHIEYLWRKKFMLDKPPLIRMTHMLKDKSNWIRKVVDETTIYYHQYHPEFKVELSDFDDSRNTPPYYAYVVGGENALFQDVYIKYSETVLDRFLAVTLDSGVYKTIVPSDEFVHISPSTPNDYYHFKYYLKDSLKFILCDFLFEDDSQEAFWARKSFYEVILIFNNVTERDDFVDYIKHHHQTLDELINDNNDYSYIRGQNPCNTKEIIKKIRTGISLHKLYQDFLKEKKTITPN